MCVEDVSFDLTCGSTCVQYLSLLVETFDSFLCYGLRLRFQLMMIYQQIVILFYFSNSLLCYIFDCINWMGNGIKYDNIFLPWVLVLTLSVPVALLNSPNLSPYFSLNKFERILPLIFSSLLCLINSHFLITKCLILCMLCKEKLGVKTDWDWKG